MNLCVFDFGRCHLAFRKVNSRIEWRKGNFRGYLLLEGDSVEESEQDVRLGHRFN